MAICPKCSAEITYLKYYNWSEEVCNYDGDYHDSDFTGNNKDNEYVCPECDETLATNEHQADEILFPNGHSTPQDFTGRYPNKFCEVFSDWYGKPKKILHPKFFKDEE